MRRFAFCLALAAGLLAAPAVRAADPPKVPDGVTYEPDLEYSNPDNQHLMVDLARPSKGDGPFPAILLIHGGGFRAGNRHGYDGLCMRLAQQGYVAATVEYRLAPEVPVPRRRLRLQGRHALAPRQRRQIPHRPRARRRHRRLGRRPPRPVPRRHRRREGVRGRGEGGNPDQSSKPACVVSFYGPSDFTKSYGHSKDAAEVLPLFLGGDLEKAHRRHIEASPLYWVTPDAAPTLCIHGTKDDYVAYEQAGWIVDKLKAADVEADLLTIEGAGHGFKGADEEKAEQAMIAFFDKHLKK